MSKATAKAPLTLDQRRERTRNAILRNADGRRAYGWAEATISAEAHARNQRDGSPLTVAEVDDVMAPPDALEGALRLLVYFEDMAIRFPTLAGLTIMGKWLVDEQGGTMTLLQLRVLVAALRGWRPYHGADEIALAADALTDDERAAFYAACGTERPDRADLYDGLRLLAPASPPD